MSLYKIYREAAKITSIFDDHIVSEFFIDNKKYTVYELKVKIGSACHIICREDGSVCLREFHPSGHATPLKSERVLCKPKRVSEEAVIVLIPGRPGMIIGLDEGIFVSAKRKIKTKNDIYVMTEEEFKNFEQ